ncbi:MAG: DUF1257 domain-containing protein [Planctomycetota bacterium]
MSCVVIVAPVIVASWPAIAHAVTAAIATTGFAILQNGRDVEAAHSTKSRAEIDIPDSEVLEDSVGESEEMTLVRDGVTARLFRDRRGALKLCLDGNASKQELQKIGEELLGAITQQYAYHKIMSDLQERGMAVVSEEVTPDRAVKIRVRAW